MGLWQHKYIGRLKRRIIKLTALLEEPQKPAVSFMAGWRENITQGAEAHMAEVTVPVGTTEKKQASVVFYDADNNVIAPDAVPTWSSSNTDVATVEAFDDGLNAVVTFGSTAGSAVIEVSTVETADDGTETTIRATGLVNTYQPDTDAVTAEVTFSDEVPEINPL